MVVSLYYLSTAFDTIAHNILLNRLENFVGISGSALAWFKSYLSDCHQFIAVNEEVSYRSQVQYGVPQGRGLHVGPEDQVPDPGPVQVRVYILNGQPGPGRVPIHYLGSRIFLTLCVIPKSIGEHSTHQRSVAVTMRVCNLQFVKLG